MSDPTFHVRQAIIDDIDNGLVESLRSLSPVHIARDKLRERLIRRLENDHYTFVAVDTAGGHVLGTVSVLIETKLTRDGSPAAHIEDVAVRKDCQSKGVGTALVDTALRYARGYGCYKVILDCDPSLVPFYERSGFYENGVCMRIDL